VAVSKQGEVSSVT